MYAVPYAYHRRHIIHRTVTLVQIEEEIQHRLGNDPGIFYNDAAAREIVIRERQVQEPSDKFGRAFCLCGRTFFLGRAGLWHEDESEHQHTCSEPCKCSTSAMDNHIEVARLLRQ